jgi:LuxR family maltose regulon positive regulatory protein
VALEAADAFLLETGNTTLLPAIQGFRAELALLQGQVATARQWADRLKSIPGLTPTNEFFSPHLTQVKAWLAQDTLASRRQAAISLRQFREHFESTHNTRFLIEVLALQALLHKAEGERSAALDALEHAITLAEPGGFIRLFVDLGLSYRPDLQALAHLLNRLYRQGVAPEYVSRVLAAFPGTTKAVRDPASPLVLGSVEGLLEQLTPRELEVLGLLDRHLTNKEIAQELVVAPATVKTHTLNIYRKLGVRTRGQAVVQARELGILQP